ncbi:hypothetical protein PLANPX_0859 [Lacipirellula parvula]|uniref:Uncharacterized protein n=1 Tax=Lacipirellula parvula TaxID=2650471 RepID=A0A5K7X5W7_9BACT|nr:hypothetical protein PLANPX_0859 [Lacipirellula parvula]
MNVSEAQRRASGMAFALGMCESLGSEQRVPAISQLTATTSTVAI